MQKHYALRFTNTIKWYTLYGFYAISLLEYMHFLLFDIYSQTTLFQIETLIKYKSKNNLKDNNDYLDNMCLFLKFHGGILNEYSAIIARSN